MDNIEKYTNHPRKRTFVPGAACDSWESSMSWLASGELFMTIASLTVLRCPTNSGKIRFYCEVQARVHVNVSEVK